MTLLRVVFISWLIALFSFRATFAQPIDARIDRYVQARFAKSSVPGLAIAVVRNDTLLFSKGYGHTANKTPITADTPFAIASLSKAFTAMAIMQLVDADQINLDAPVVHYIPSFQLNDAKGASITVRQLLHQTSGLTDTGFPELALSEQPATLDEAIAQMRAARLVSKPDEQFHYHNPNYRVLAKIVETVSHEPFPVYLQAHIFEPLHMEHTSDVPTTKALVEGKQHVAKGHVYVLGQPVPIQEPDWFIDGSAGMRSSVNDMASWLRLQLNYGRFDNLQLLSAKSLAAMHNPLDSTKSRYGMGWIVDQEHNLYHSGILWTYSAEQLLLTKDGYGVVILFNGGLNPFVDYNSFIRGIAAILTNQEPEYPTLPDWVFPIAIDAILLVIIGLAVRRLLRLNQWFQTYHRHPRWRGWLYLFGRLIPFFIILFSPHLVTALSGRVLSAERIFLMLPDVAILFGTVALLNLLIVVTRLIHLFRLKTTFTN
ncbi:serine hydrolase domain-containing protein [Spirosoma daeguense]